MTGEIPGRDPAEQQSRALRPGTNRDKLPVVNIHADDFEAYKQDVAHDLMEVCQPAMKPWLPPCRR